MGELRVTGYTDLEQDGDRTTALAHYSDGTSRRVNVRVSVETQIHRADGTDEEAKEVASTDAGTVRVGAAA